MDEEIRSKKREYYEANKEKFVEYRKKYYQSNKQKILERNKEWGRLNPEKKREQARRYYHKHKPDKTKYKASWFEANFEKKLLSQAKRTAKVRGMAFDLELSDIYIPEVCPYLKIKLDRKIYQGRIPNRASIDRIDSTKGYIKGNVQVISDLANRMKQNASEEHLIEFAKNVLLIHKGEK